MSLEFQEVCPDVPRRMKGVHHFVDVGNAPPTKQHPYMINPLINNNTHEKGGPVYVG